jgi:hypothetical protein
MLAKGGLGEGEEGEGVRAKSIIGSGRCVFFEANGSCPFGLR